MTQAHERSKRLPPWFKVRLTTSDQFTQVNSLIRANRLHTVCRSAACPNQTASTRLSFTGAFSASLTMASTVLVRISRRQRPGPREYGRMLMCSDLRWPRRVP